MNQEAFRELLLARQAALKDLHRDAADDRAPVALDQQSVGRLSRMDAMQQQAMAVATNARRLHEMRAIKAALIRIEKGDFGVCDECGEQIAEQRLNLYPTITLCIACAEALEA